ncbi:MAG: class I SAM-dependent RNA methyltransferase [Proteobacteria bacterium]|nr:class I SAM-dependent RNA methyltransferase [Pseudomonadota bacterium]
MTDSTKIYQDEKSYIAEISNLSYSSAGVARFDGKVAFIPYTVTGDVVKFTVERDRKTYLDGKLKEILKSSPHRRTYPCPYFGNCGGCQWQHINYNYQVISKKNITKDILERIGRIANPDVSDTYTAGGEWNYRQRVRFQVGLEKNEICLGFNVYNSNKVVDIDNCYILKKPVVEVLKELKKYKNELRGILDFEIYYSSKENNFVFSGKAKEDNFNPSNLKKVSEIFKGGIVRTKKGRVFTLKDPYLTYSIELNRLSYNLKVYADGFIQANPEVNAVILNSIADYLGDNYQSATMLELFSGSGNFSFLFSKLCKYVVAVEGNNSSFRALEENIAKNNILNIHPIRAGVRDEVLKMFNNKRSFDLVFLDPPRIGAKEIMPYIPKFNPKIIIYLSCNPTTLARDIQTLAYSGYTIEKVVPFDMFPQTFHIETMVILKR